MANKNSKKESTPLSKKRLLPYEREQHKLIGEVDPSQNWLEIFTPAIVSDLFTIMHNCSNNRLKAEYIQKEMEYYGFRDVSLGTNIYTMSNPAYPGVVFKFALDDNGLADNFNDEILSDLIDECLGGHVSRSTQVLMRHPSGIVSVQQRWVVVRDQDRMDTFRNSILKALRKLSEKFLIVDLSPSHYHLNYGVDRNGDWHFLDASDLYPLSNIKEKIQCKKAIGYDDKKKKMKRCGGRLRYNEDFSLCICTKCGAEYYPLELRPKDKEDAAKMANSMMDGLSLEEREDLRQEEMAQILRNRKQQPKAQLSTMYGKWGDADEQKRPRAGFTDPKRDEEIESEQDDEEDDPVVIVSSSDDDDEPDVIVRDVERQKVFEPDAELVQRTATPFDRNDDEPKVIIVTEDDKPEQEDPPETPAPTTDEYTGYAMFNIDVDEDGDSECIKVTIHGDVTSAIENCMLPIFVSFDDTPEEYKAISAQAMSDLLLPVVLDLEEEKNAIYQQDAFQDGEDDQPSEG